MEITKLESLIKLFGQSNLGKLELAEKDLRIILERQSDTTTLGIKPVEPVSSKPTSSQTTVSLKTETIINAPLVGTVYLAPEPRKPVFVQVGDHVQKGQTLALIEAMKMMNEVTATTTGTIKKVLVADETVVEYDQPLFELEE
ncbi:acetyl-CoA carboxylase biotin carboxyl carrier protein [Liquorilactobacillus capillatus]|uniref:Biotin carboxyl carrier protein of acetyl-CoA carboxylase n=1 Tax=Liquorilactobacillus capillatus DSM 19910 TaxID=1423731 RepID=A0A0R1MA58_9LACO|nr:biotin/lipoyl-containing protein [Liquorilactobacillus capillatus]KRL01738.1 hypothetical protein FC81_GL001103 [Liquorilactobacillus capillatus DSM 19910]